MSVSIGATLKQARDLRQLTLEQVSEATKIRSHYLRALESDDYSAIPSAAQARGFLRIYSQFLGLNLADLVPPPPPAPVAAPVSEAALAADSGSGSKSSPLHFLTNLRERFAPRPAKTAAASAPTVPAVPSPEPASPAPEVVAPPSVPEPVPAAAEVTREPAAAVAVETPQPVVTPVPESTAASDVKTKSRTRRSSTGPRKAAAGADTARDVKKNASK